MEIRLCPCNKGNGRQNLRNKRTEDTKEIKAQLFQNYIPEIVPFTMESKRNNSAKYVMPNKTSDNDITSTIFLCPSPKLNKDTIFRIQDKRKYN